MAGPWEAYAPVEVPKRDPGPWEAYAPSAELPVPAAPSGVIIHEARRKLQVMADKPPFDPSRPFEAVTDKPAFDPSKPFEAVGSPDQAAPDEHAAPVAAAPAAVSWVRQKLRDKVFTEGQKLRDKVLAEAPAEVGPRPPAVDQIKGTVTDIPREIYSAGKGALTQAAEGLNPFSETNRFGFRAQIDAPLGERLGHLGSQYANVGKGSMAVPAIAAAPVTGANRAAIGHPYSVLTGLPYEQAKEAVDLAMTGLSPRGVSPIGARTIPAPVPSGAQLYRSAKAGYKSPEVAAVEIHPQSIAALSQRIESNLLNEGFRPSGGQSGAGQTFGIVKEIVPPRGVQSVKIADYDAAAKALRNVAKERDFQGRQTPDAAAANLSLRYLDEYLTQHLPSNPNEVLAGDISQAVPILKAAQGNWAALKKSGEVERRLTLAELQAAKSGSGGNVENAMRPRIAEILTKPKGSIGYRPDELAKVEEIVKGTPLRNTLRIVGKAGVAGGLDLLLHGATAIGTGGASLPYQLPVLIGGTSARLAGQALTSRAIGRLGGMIRARSPLARSLQPIQLSPPSRRDLLAAALLRQGQSVPYQVQPGLRR